MCNGLSQRIALEVYIRNSQSTRLRLVDSESRMYTSSAILLYVVHGQWHITHTYRDWVLGGTEEGVIFLNSYSFTSLCLVLAPWACIVIHCLQCIIAIVHQCVEHLECTLLWLIDLLNNLFVHLLILNVIVFIGIVHNSRVQTIAGKKINHRR